MDSQLGEERPMKETILIDEAAIAKRVSELAEQMNVDYRGRELLVIAIANGALLFAADLFRLLRGDARLDVMKASSYQSARRGELVFEESFHLPLEGRHVLLVDDILDSGTTLRKISERIRLRNPASLRTCVLLDKPAGRLCVFQADYVGFTIPDRYVYGYGMDDAFGLRRNRPFVATED